MSNVGRILYNNGHYRNNVNYKKWRVEAEGWDWLVIREIEETHLGPDAEFVPIVLEDRQTFIETLAKPPSDD